MKRRSGSSSSKRKIKSVNKQEIPSSSLAWSAVPLPLEATAQAGQTDADFFQGFSYDDADFMGLTEVEGVEVVRDKDGIVKFVVEKDGLNGATKGKGKATELKSFEHEEPHQRSSKRQKIHRDPSSSLPQAIDIDLPHTNFEDDDDSANDKDEGSDQQNLDINADFALLAEDIEGEHSNSIKWTKNDTIKKLPAWNKLRVRLHPLLYQSLHTLKFERPTKIQEETLPVSITENVTISDNNRDIIGVAQTGSGKTLAYGLPILHWIASHSVEDRQMRLLNGVPKEEISSRLSALILTPTRELALQVAKHLSTIIDSSSSEKKRWASIATITGGMSEDKQRRMLQGYRGRGVDIIVATPGRLWELCRSDDALARRIKTTRFLVVDEADRMIETGHFAEMQNIFSLVQRIEDGQDRNENDLQHNLKRANRMKRKRKGQNASTVEELLEAIDFRDNDPFMIDQSTSTRIASNVMEVKSECLAKDKDLFLYYFLLRYPGRTLVFVNAIDGIRRLQPLLENLQISVQPLHSQLQQKQRLKNMDRFRSNKQPSIGGSAVLLATDVAARGLDIPAVDHVVHFQIPRTADTYVHRSGRTARGGKEGVSLALIEPSEKRVWHDLCKSLQRKDDLASMPIEYTFLSALKERVTLAKQIDQATHTQKKASHDDAWLRKLAEEAEMDLSEVEEEGEDRSQSNKKVNETKSVHNLRSRLTQLIKTPLRARGISAKYITSGDRDFVDSLLDDRHHGSLIGLHKATLHEDIQQPKMKERKSKQNGKLG
ncbi:hypothetical protein L7F22_053867 [Adiantum nelumboides]|nr:hypothetical protein [Adiantum nelumboides]